MDQTPWQVWVTQQMTRHGWETQADVARASGLPPASISQWLGRRQQPSVKNCRRAAEAFGVPILRALVAAEHLTAEEAKMKPSEEQPLHELTIDQLLDEVRRRFRDR